MRKPLALLLLLPAFVPCGLPWDACDEASAQGCSAPCHLGCGVLASPGLVALGTPAGFAPDAPRLDLEAHPIFRPHLPELPPPRS